MKGAGRYLGAKWMTKITGVRLLTDALAALDCEVDDIIERHSHDIVIGRVRYVHLSSNRSAGVLAWEVSGSDSKFRYRHYS